MLFAAPALAVPDLQSLGLDPDHVLPGGTSTGTVTLTEPAANDTVITLSASPSTGATLPGTVTVLTGQSQATFQVTDGGVGGQTTIGATLGATSVFHDLTAVSSLSHLVVNEVDYDQPGNPDSGEFLELYNGGPNVDLTHLAVAFVNGATSTEYDRESLAASRCLVSGGYLVIADSPVTPTPGALVQRFVTPNSSIQNGGSGSPDGVALVDTSTHTLLDALSYDGSITAATLDGFPATVSLVEGTATTAVDSSVSAGSLGRSPNGQDTDNANSDWAFNATASPGSPNGGSVASVPGACPNHAPQLATVGDRSVVAGQTLSFTLSGTDADGDTLTYGASNLPAGATVDPASGAFSWTPSALQVGTYPGVHLTASDGSATAATDITITVTAPEMAPGGSGGGGGGGSTPPPGDTTGPVPVTTPTTSSHPSAAPDTKILSLKVNARKLTVKFRGSGVSFQCKLDRGRFKTCKSPASYKHLKRGKHLFTVRAKNAAGTVDPTPATKKFVVKR